MPMYMTSYETSLEPSAAPVWYKKNRNFRKINFLFNTVLPSKAQGRLWSAKWWWTAR